MLFQSRNHSLVGVSSPPGQRSVCGGRRATRLGRGVVQETWDLVLVIGMPFAVEAPVGLTSLMTSTGEAPAALCDTNLACTNLGAAIRPDAEQHEGLTNVEDDWLETDRCPPVTLERNYKHSATTVLKYLSRLDFTRSLAQPLPFPQPPS